MEQIQVNQKESIAQFAGAQFIQYGIKSVSMDDIAKKLGISKKTIYLSFENKKDLVRVFISQFVEIEKKDIEAMVNQAENAIEKLIDIHNYSLDMLKKLSKSFMYDLFKYYRSEWELVENLHKKYMVDLFIKNLIQGKKEGLYTDQLNEELIAKLFIQSSFLIVGEDLFPAHEYNKQKLIEDHFNYHIRAISTEKGKKILKIN